MKTYQSRKEVPEKYKWDLTEYYQDINAWEEEFQNIKKELPKFQSFVGKLHDAKELENFLKLDTQLLAKIEDLYLYADICHDTDLENEKYTDLYNRAYALSSEYERAVAFATPEILSLNKNEYQNLIESTNLKPYKRLLEKIYREKEHTLSEREEQLIALLTENYNSYSAISNSLLNSEHQYGKIKVKDQNITIATNNVRFLKQNEEERVRKEVENKFGKVLKQYENTAASLLNYHVKNNINIAMARNYESPFATYLFQNEMTEKVYSAIHDVAVEGKETYQKYFHLMKKVLKKKTLHSYDTLLPWSKKNKEYSVEEAIKMVREALKPLGDEYLEKWERVNTNHCIDYMQYKGKRSGGYCISTQDKQARILMSYNGTIDDISTIAHESGHFTHHEFIHENNPGWYSYVPSYIAEVASLTNEFLFSDYLVKNGKTKEEKLKGLENFIKMFYLNFFTSIIEGNMEFEMYNYAQNGGTITAEYLNNLSKKELAKYKDNTVKLGKYQNQGWITRSHYYMDFYLYSYAICVSIATIIASRIIKKEEGMVQKYYEFLKCGGDLTPLEIYSKLEIDVTKKETFQEALAYFDQKLDEYEEIANRGE